MAFEHYIQNGARKLRCGYTTGTCAALAAAGAAEQLLSGQAPERVRLVSPKGWQVEAELLHTALVGGVSTAAVAKDAGDDVDVTNGMLVFADVCLSRHPGIRIDGGEGIGRVTKPGLDQPVGAAAINSVPRRMITEQVSLVCEEAEYSGGLQVIIRVPGGRELSRRTFNPQLGIEGGLSILGSSGVVEPMSNQALVDTITLSIRQARAEGATCLILVPGNYGLHFIQEHGFDRRAPIVKCANFIGDALDAAGAEGFSSVLLVGHVGKLVKLAGGVMNTHSRYADCRTEIFCAHAAVCGADTALCRALMGAASSDGCIELLDTAGLRGAVMSGILASIDQHMKHRVAGKYCVGAVLFSNRYGLLGYTPTAADIMKTWE